jgi:hypothetical protein
MPALVRLLDRAREGPLRRRPNVVDGCLLFNELDVLELRLQELWPVVDRFVVVEATFSHAGAPKPAFLSESAERFAPYREKLVVRVLGEAPLANPRSEAERRVLEAFQRDAIGHAVEGLGLRGSDVVLVSDVDEIPRPSAVSSVHRRLWSEPYAVFVQDFLHHWVNHAWPDGRPPGWLGTVACRRRTARAVGTHRVRRGRDRAGHLAGARVPRASYVEAGGWHLTWLGGAEACWTKAQNVMDAIDRASGLRDRGPRSEIRVYPAATSREECRAVQDRWLAEAEAPGFTPLDFDRFEIEQDVPEHLRRNRERFRRWFFFTSGLGAPEDR